MPYRLAQLEEPHSNQTAPAYGLEAALSISRSAPLLRCPREHSSPVAVQIQQASRLSPSPPSPASCRHDAGDIHQRPGNGSQADAVLQRLGRVSQHTQPVCADLGGIASPSGTYVDEAFVHR